ncbi:conserved hypothetical protein [Talaromyces marneffei ATCC 18224]|uniref:GED domain-containing protein n=1 Tax=Talaromyces marneffei (strain ATCC 18224 / CBS 334.59 / QM 7333) TaxID=441960 RepID=B6QRN9_TALMQ|nr:conserved hypothetical protein [Talaromyces marneffei ATCC 18224]
MDGSYKDQFFEDTKSPDGLKRRLRAIIQTQSDHFANDMAGRGHRFEIYQQGFNRAAVPQGIIPFTKEDMTEHIRHLMLQTRGKELSSSTNSMVVADLFRENSAPWGDLAHDYIASIWKAVEGFVHQAITQIAGPTTAQVIFSEVLQPALNILRDDLRSKTEELLMPYKFKHPITYHRDFLATVQRHHEHCQVSDIARILSGYFDDLNNAMVQARQDITSLARGLIPPTDTDTELACADAYDCMMIYYKIAMNHFMDNMAIYAVEVKVSTHLEQMFLPASVISMTPDCIKRLAGESEETKILREQLVKQLCILVSGLETCKRFAHGSLSQQARGMCFSFKWFGEFFPGGPRFRGQVITRLESVREEDSGNAAAKGQSEDLPMSNDPHRPFSE